MSFMVTTEAFLAERLGGRLEGVGGDFEGSFMSIQIGAEPVMYGGAAGR